MHKIHLYISFSLPKIKSTIQVDYESLIEQAPQLPGKTDQEPEVKSTDRPLMFGRSCRLLTTLAALR